MGSSYVMRYSNLHPQQANALATIMLGETGSELADGMSEVSSADGSVRPNVLHPSLLLIQLSTD